MKRRTLTFYGVLTLLLPCLFSVSLLEQGSAQNRCDRTPILVRNASVWTPVGADQDRDVLFENDRIASIQPGGSITPSAETRILDGRGQTLLPGLRTKFQQLLATGTSLAIGTDVGPACHFQSGGIWWELEAWRAFGAGSRQALTAATAAGARVLRDERAGALKEGGYADFVLYSGDAEKGDFDLGRVRAVAKAGVLFVKDGEWIGPREDSKYVARRRWHASML